MSHLNFSLPESIVQEVRRGSVVTPKPNHLPYSLRIDYCVHHISEDMETIKAILYEKYNAYAEAYVEAIENSNLLRPFNMFLMNWVDFNRYCDWLFGILEEAEKRIRIEYYNPVQRRIWGYMAERLFNVWLYAEQKKVIGKPVIWIDDEKANYQPFSLQIPIVVMRNELIMKLFRIRRKRLR